MFTRLVFARCTFADKSPFPNFSQLQLSLSTNSLCPSQADHFLWENGQTVPAAVHFTLPAAGGNNQVLVAIQNIFCQFGATVIVADLYVFCEYYSSTDCVICHPDQHQVRAGNHHDFDKESLLNVVIFGTFKLLGKNGKNGRET